MEPLYKFFMTETKVQNITFHESQTPEMNLEIQITKVHTLHFHVERHHIKLKTIKSQHFHIIKIKLELLKIYTFSVHQWN